jgi:hypothetical protein
MQLLEASENMLSTLISFNDEREKQHGSSSYQDQLFLTTVSRGATIDWNEAAAQVPLLLSASEYASASFLNTGTT